MALTFRFIVNVVDYVVIRCCLVSLFALTTVCYAQEQDSYDGVLITRVNKIGKGSDTSHLLYCSNKVGDSLTVYTVKDNMLSESSTYHLTALNNSLFFCRTLLRSGEQMEERLELEFLDQSHSVMINNTDQYTLFPTHYVKFKHDVGTLHSVIAFLSLLSDAIGDYPISDVLPLASYTPKLNKEIAHARIVTQRNHADMTDIWTCEYYYNKHNQLDSVRAFSHDEVRFSKQIHYQQSNVVRIITYLNIESRQITNRFFTYDMTDGSTIKWRERIFETGKNHETVLLVKLIKNVLKGLGKMTLSQTEILKLIKSHTS